jgi:hypothetical protein
VPGEPRDGSLGRQTVLTQYGRRDTSGFRMRPRPGVEEGISLIAGRLDVAEAHRLVVRRGFPKPGVDGVRHTTVGDLEDAGFLVRAAPTRAIRDHVLVGYEGQWDDQVAERFDACFGPLDEEE